MAYEYGHDCPFEAYITNLGKYNEGELVGEWVKFPTTSEDLQKVFERIGIGSKDDFGNPYEEWFISDYDVYGGRLPRTCVSRIGLMPGAAFGLPLHSFHFQKIKKFAFLKATSCIYY